ncbi:VOC family protein [Acidipila sp. EB88]|uniref:VOC family protein n=1 Tax=Acidipila sp. EB88 TaxID=2305226 RepID=UPI0013159B31|nr:VOC family protein [Acidipila sp. EB88]
MVDLGVTHAGSTGYLAALSAGEVGVHPPAYRLPAKARVGRVRLAVSNLERSLDFYTRVIGLTVVQREHSVARLGLHGEVLLELEEVPGVQPLAGGKRLGLYHTAFLLPSREALSAFVQHLLRQNIAFGAGDHLYSEALYLEDPDGLNVEVYADRDRSTWTVEQREIVSATNQVRFEQLPRVEPGSWTGAPAGTTIGHLHFYVGDLREAARFYHAGLGLDIVTWRYPGALFASAGGYHHHVGLNVWAAGSPQAGAQDARLLWWELVLPGALDVEQAGASLAAAGYAAVGETHGRFVDPWGICVSLRAEDSAG